MPLNRWLMLIAMVVGLGCLQVAQRNAVFLEGYAVGERMKNVHTQETSLSWLNAQVTGLASPTHLAHVAQERRLELVAWSALPHETSSTHSAGRFAWLRGGSNQQRDENSRESVRIATGEPTSRTSGNDTSD